MSDSAATVPKCGTCKWFHERTCHRYPPERPGSYVHGMWVGALFVAVHVSDWCGEHTPKEEANADTP